jgi:hypothetical protein
MDQTLSTQEIAKLLQVQSIKAITAEANLTGLVSDNLALDWDKDRQALNKKKKLVQKKQAQAYIIQQTTLKPVKPDGHGKKKTKGEASFSFDIPMALVLTTLDQRWKRPLQLLSFLLPRRGRHDS